MTNKQIMFEAFVLGNVGFLKSQNWCQAGSDLGG